MIDGQPQHANGCVGEFGTVKGTPPSPILSLSLSLRLSYHNIKMTEASNLWGLDPLFKIEPRRASKPTEHAFATLYAQGGGS